MIGDGLTLGWLLECALRSLILGVCVFALLKLVRLRDVGAETLIWTTVLSGALAMPLLSTWLPGRILLSLPHLQAPAVTQTSVVRSGVVGVMHGPSTITLIWVAYWLVAALGLIRLATGLVLTLRLYRAARPITEPWADGLKVRASAAVAGPFSFADRILLPMDYPLWSAEKLRAVLAHEQAHVRRGDFFIHLLAALHRALFWFNPFAWWLQAKLSELAERASDKAAIMSIQDRAAYAEILVETARMARRLPHYLNPGPAMARGPGVARRVDDILSAAPERSIAAPVRAAAMMGVLATAFAFAEVKAQPLDALARPGASPMAQRQILVEAAVNRMVRSAPAPAHAETAKGHARTAVAKSAAPPVSQPTASPTAFT